MLNELDGMMGFDRLGLYYEVHMLGIDGECFYYNVYFDDGLTAARLAEVQSAIDAFLAPYNEKEVYLGYIDVSDNEEKAGIYLDIGGVDPDNANDAIYGVLRALNDVTGIRQVLINE